MIRFYGSILLFLFYLSDSTAQKKEFDSIYRVTIQEIIYNDPIEAIENADFLISISPNNELTIRVLLLKAKIFRMGGLHDEAIKVLQYANSLHDPSNHQQNLLIHGLLATNYYEQNSTIASQKHLNEVKRIVMSIPNLDERNKLLATIYQRISSVHTEQKEHQKAIENIHRSINFLKLIDPIKMNMKFSRALNYQILGENFLKLHNTDSSIVYFNKALTELEDSLISDTALKGFILNGLAKNMILKNDYGKVKEYLNKAEKIAHDSQNKSLLKDFYHSKTSLYKETGDSEKYVSANEHYLALLNQEKLFEKKLNENLIRYLNLQSFDNEEEENDEKGFLKLKYLFSVFGVLLLSFIFFIVKRKKTKSIHTTEKTTNEKEELSNHTNKEYMSEEAMNAIVEKLKELESEKFYLENNLSLASVAAEVGVNHRYLSHSIHQKLGKDFTSYINDLRIDYIIDFLKKDPKHLQYKISYLAEISGFSSHNRFSIIFKRSKGINPSELIQQLQEQEESKKLQND